MVAPNVTPPAAGPAFAVGRFSFPVEAGHPPTSNPTETLDHAITRVWTDVWQRQRSGRSILSQGELALEGLYEVDPALSPESTIGEITRSHIRAARDCWLASGLSASTVTKRLCCLAQMGAHVAGLKPPKTRVLKWCSWRT